MTKILIIEDDSEVAKMVGDSLKFQHYAVESVGSAEEGLERLSAYTYDVVIIDWTLPGMSGLEALKEYRGKGGTTPVLMLTGRHRIVDKEAGLDSGCNDYLTKPFDVQELSARIRALLRRAGGRLSGNVLQVGNLTLEPGSFQVQRDNVQIKLLPKEFALLEFFMRHPNVVFSTDALISRVWTADEESSPEIIRTHVKNLRKKLDVAGQPSIIETIHGVGYKLLEPKP